MIPTTNIYLYPAEARVVVDGDHLGVFRADEHPNYQQAALVHARQHGATYVMWTNRRTNDKQEQGQTLRH